MLHAIYTYINYIILNIFGWFRDFLRRTGIEHRPGAADPNTSVSESIDVENQRFTYLCDSITFLLGFCAIISKLRELLYT